MLRRILITLGALAFVALGAAPAAAAEPSLHQVYQAAQAGQYRDAQTMMDQVLRNHPDSAKAHFVEAELLAKQGLVAKAQSALQTAERLAPGLPFARPGAVQALRTRLGAAPAAGSSGLPGFRNPVTPALADHGLPWGLLVGLGLVAVIFFVARSMFRQSPDPLARAGFGNQLSGPGVPPFGPNPGGAMPWNGGGAGVAGMGGAGVLGSLATGAAVGAGLVAGEALMHRVLDHERPVTGSNTALPPEAQADDSRAAYDMGGADFGVNDDASWDDGTGGVSDSDDWT